MRTHSVLSSYFIFPLALAPTSEILVPSLPVPCLLTQMLVSGLSRLFFRKVLKSDLHTNTEAEVSLRYFDNLILFEVAHLLETERLHIPLLCVSFIHSKAPHAVKYSWRVGEN